MLIGHFYFFVLLLLPLVFCNFIISLNSQNVNVII